MFYYEEGKDIKNELIVNELKELTYDSPLSQLILIMTDNCNLKCEYCIYSDKYPKDIEYSRRKMDFNTAKLSIDKYFELHKERKKHGLNKSANVSFYGGEPLLNFDLIKKSVEYIKNRARNNILYYNKWYDNE
ncbi:4Fe-4S single cluster domain-containing protein [Clostridium sp. DSM 8431]|uniref:radical SAM protein n=1 Tax=Clostridium sp. DSM 8431 TaxID=1761781 RepID=UPI0008EB62B7|nr:radical SAM protein [Clostridium sp. DSM 8431]SFU53022.1 4Fe-4S single cluster domain-containing protein [Clostridium sp. DSM 8431]